MKSLKDVCLLGIAQLICWGVSYYIVGVFGELMVSDLGWNRTTVFGGFATGLLAMGLVSPVVGSMIDRFGGRIVMGTGATFIAVACSILAVAENLTVFYGAWLLMGVSMRACLYDAAFATLTRIYGPEARRPIAHITLFGGLASSCFWPIGHALAEQLGWRGALFVYSAFALSTVPMYWALTRSRYEPPRHVDGTHVPERATPEGWKRKLAGALYALIFIMNSGLVNGVAAHMISMLTGIGLGAAVAVSVAAFVGVSQSAARLIQILFGRNMEPVHVAILATALIPLGLVIGLFGGTYFAIALVFCGCYGAGNGLTSIARGTLPLVLFSHKNFGATVGKLLAPSFFIAAGSPLLFASMMESYGPTGTFKLAIGLSLVTLAAAVALRFVAPPPAKS